MKILSILVIITSSLAIKVGLDVKESYDKLLEKKCPSDTAYYKCGGNKRNPKWCPINIYE